MGLAFAYSSSSSRPPPLCSSSPAPTGLASSYMFATTRAWHVTLRTPMNRILKYHCPIESFLFPATRAPHAFSLETTVLSDQRGVTLAPQAKRPSCRATQRRVSSLASACLATFLVDSQ